MRPVSNNINIKNKRASFDYEFIDTYTAGIVLTGTEIKSIRAGRASMSDAFCFFVFRRSRPGTFGRFGTTASPACRRYGARFTHGIISPDRFRRACLHAPGHFLQRGDAVFRVRVGREQVVHALARERIDDEHMRGGRVAFGRGVMDSLRRARDLVQRRSQP